MQIAAVISDCKHPLLAFNPAWVEVLAAFTHKNCISPLWSCLRIKTLRENLKAARSIGMKAVRIDRTPNADTSEPVLLCSLTALSGLPLPPS
jgi:hypothetical protein